MTETQFPKDLWIESEDPDAERLAELAEADKVYFREVEPRFEQADRETALFEQAGIPIPVLQTCIQIALADFCEEDQGARPWKKEITSRLSRLRTVGYPVPAYSHRSYGNLRHYFDGLRRKLRRLGGKYAPETVKEADERNQIDRNVR